MITLRNFRKRRNERPYQIWRKTTHRHSPGGANKRPVGRCEKKLIMCAFYIVIFQTRSEALPLLLLLLLVLLLQLLETRAVEAAPGAADDSNLELLLKVWSGGGGEIRKEIKWVTA